jgi:hypothetical protein
MEYPELEIYANRYDNLEHLRANIEEFIERYYNRHVYIRRWAIDPPMNLNNKRSTVRQNLSVQAWNPWCTMSLLITRRRVLQSYLGRGLKRRPLPQTPSPASRYGNALYEFGDCVQKNCAILGVHPLSFRPTSVHIKG